MIYNYSISLKILTLPLKVRNLSRCSAVTSAVPRSPGAGSFQVVDQPGNVDGRVDLYQQVTWSTSPRTPGARNATHPVFPQLLRAGNPAVTASAFCVDAWSRIQYAAWANKPHITMIRFIDSPCAQAQHGTMQTQTGFHSAVIHQCTRRLFLRRRPRLKTMLQGGAESAASNFQVSTHS